MNLKSENTFEELAKQANHFRHETYKLRDYMFLVSSCETTGVLLSNDGARLDIRADNNWIFLALMDQSQYHIQLKLKQ